MSSHLTKTMHLQIADFIEAAIADAPEAILQLSVIGAFGWTIYVCAALLSGAA